MNPNSCFVRLIRVQAKQATAFGSPSWAISRTVTEPDRGQSSGATGGGVGPVHFYLRSRRTECPEMRSRRRTVVVVEERVIRHSGWARPEEPSVNGLVVPGLDDLPTPQKDVQTSSKMCQGPRKTCAISQCLHRVGRVPVPESVEGRTIAPAIVELQTGEQANGCEAGYDAATKHSLLVRRLSPNGTTTTTPPGALPSKTRLALYPHDQDLPITTTGIMPGLSSSPDAGAREVSVDGFFTTPMHDEHDDKICPTTSCSSHRHFYWSCVHRGLQRRDGRVTAFGDYRSTLAYALIVQESYGGAARRLNGRAMTNPFDQLD
ncbi:hypothetical protein DFP72DRAFT_845654 [Ephemerocybe angulata]|uniref:Uncharacterized protein n=1 Tax=Ephemerocybe angulata TaxID=980116 RepID=A0A8H6MA59_9AGAR|nr:hypothetical protein DFP72DRAFT_845654 [Tulosesus angulatus]